MEILILRNIGFHSPQYSSSPIAQTISLSERLLKDGGEEMSYQRPSINERLETVLRLL